LNLYKLWLDKLIDVFIDELLSVNNDIGWRSGGDKMSPSAPIRTDSVDAKMINEIQNLKEPHPDFAIIWAAMQTLSLNCQDAVIAKRLKAHINKNTNRQWTDTDRAEFLNISLSAYKSRCKRGYAKLETEINRLRSYEASKCVKVQ